MGVMSQFATDSYTPSLPHIAEHFHVPEIMSKLTVGIYFLGMGLSTFLMGYFIDQYGIKKVLIGGYLLFSLGSVLCFFAQSEGMLILFRLIQGVAMAGSLVGFRALMKDVFKEGHHLARASLIISSVVSFTPPLAPISGGIIQEYLGWRYNFALHLILAVLIVLIIIKYLHVKSSSIARQKFWRRYRAIFLNKTFMLNAACSGCAFSIVFVFVTLAPFLCQDVLDLTPTQYSWLLAAIIMPPAILVILLKNIVSRLNMDALMIGCASISIIGGVVMALSYVLWGSAIKTIIIACIIIFSGNAFQYTATYVCAYKNITDNVGAASAEYGFMQIMITSLVSLGVSTITINSQWPLGILMAIPAFGIIVIKLIEIKSSSSLASQ